MKRAAEPNFPPPRTPVAYMPGRGIPIGQPPGLPIPSSVSGVGSQPTVASTTDRTGAAMLPALGLQQPDQDKKPFDIAGSFVEKGCAEWLKTAGSLKGEPRKNFLVWTLLYLGAKERIGSGCWHGMAERIIQELGMDALLKQAWPPRLPVVHILAQLKNGKWLEQALVGVDAIQALSLKDANGFTPLMIAAMLGRKKTVQRILAYDDDADTLRMAETKSGQLALHHACVNNHESVVALLLSRKGGEQRLHRSAFGFLPLHCALQHGANMDVLPQLLADCAVEQTHAQIDIGANALMMAAYRGPAAAVDMLLAVPGAMAGQLEARTKDGLGAIDHARLGGNAEVIARIEAAMGARPASSATTTTTTTTNSATSTSTSTTAADISPSSASEGPVPLTPFPATPAPAYDDEFSETAEDPD